MTLGEAAWIVEHGRYIKAYRPLIRTFRVILQRFLKKRTLAEFFPAAAMGRALLERRILDYRIPVCFGWRLRLFNRVIMAYLKFSTSFWNWYCHRDIERGLHARPGMNDYYMVLWLVTGSPVYLLVLFERARAIDWAPAHQGGEAQTEHELMMISCRWMLASLRQRHADLDERLCILEAYYESPLLAPTHEDLSTEDPEIHARAKAWLGQ